MESSVFAWALMTQKSCAAGMCNAKLWNHFKRVLLLILRVKWILYMYILIVLLLTAAAYLTYMRSLKDSQKRRRVQGKLEHKIVCRRQGRLREVRNLSCFFFGGGGGKELLRNTILELLF